MCVCQGSSLVLGGLLGPTTLGTGEEGEMKIIKETYLWRMNADSDECVSR